MLMVLFGGFLFVTGPSAYAQTTADVCQGVQFTGAGGCPDGGAEGRLTTVVRSFLQVFSMVVGIVAVAMIVFAGFRYITAGGDSAKTATAQQTIIYAVVGLVIAGLSQIIVRFVITTAS